MVKSLRDSGVKRVVLVTNGQMLNALGKPVAGVYINGEIFLNLDYRGRYH